MDMRWSFVIVVVIVMVIVSSPPKAGAVGLFVRPSELTVTSPVGEERTVCLTARNTSGDVALFEVYADDPAAPVAVEPTSFTLQSGEEREVTVTVRPREAGRLETAIALTAQPLAALGLRAGAGVKVPLHIVASGGRAAGLAAVTLFFGNTANDLLLGGFVLALVLVFKLVPRLRRRPPAP